MDLNQNRGRTSLQGHNNHRSPTPSPHQYHDASSSLGLDPSVSPQTFTSGKFVTSQQFSTSFLDSTHPQTPHQNPTDAHLYSHNQFNHNAFQDNQWQAQALDPSYTNSEYLFQDNNMNDMQSTFQDDYQIDNQLATNQQSNVNPADLSSPHGPSPTSLLSPDSHASPPQPPSPASTQGHYYTPQHSRHQSLDPASAAYSPSEWQGMSPAFQGHRRVPSEQSDMSSNSASPYIPQQDVFESIENGRSPLVRPQQDGSQTFGLDTFSLADKPHSSPGHSPYISPRLLPQQNQGLGFNQEVLMTQHNLGQNNGGPGPEIYATQPEESYGEVSQMQNRNDSTVSDNMGQADQYVTPSINIEPAPVSRQASFEVETKTFAVADALQPPASKSCEPISHISLC
jgi:transcription factor CRZ1